MRRSGKRLSPPPHIGACWTAIRQADCPLVLDRRRLPDALSITACNLLEQVPELDWRLKGTPAEVLAELEDLPTPLRDDIGDLATRFAALMGAPHLRLRLEAIHTNACRKIHADHTDVRLITTYVGPASDYIPPHRPAETQELQRMAAGWIGLFKGRAYGDGHPPCFHRSPPVGDTGEARLLLVIDTPEKP